MSMFQHRADNPFHISVGAVLVNAEGNIAVHAFPQRDLLPDVRNAVPNVENIYILMRESLEEGETLDEAVLRGLREEFGAVGTIKRYMGSIQARAYSEDRAFEKTTLYFEVTLDSLGERPPEDDEIHSQLMWVAPEELLEHMRMQANPLRGDLDESKIIESYIAYR